MPYLEAGGGMTELSTPSFGYFRGGHSAMIRQGPRSRQVLNCNARVQCYRIAMELSNFFVFACLLYMVFAVYQPPDPLATAAIPSSILLIYFRLVLQALP